MNLRSGLRSAGLAFGWVTPSCVSDYPLAPTFCDDWCRATAVRAGCDDEPENCVRECEQTLAGDACFERQRRLLDCYEEATRAAFVCVDADFGNEARVARGVCQAERDALFECESPGIGACLELCRGFQEQQVAVAFEPAPTAPEADCPLLDVSCETTCWNLAALGSPLAAGLSSGDASASSASANEDDADVTSCILDGLARCFVGSSPTGLRATTPVQDWIAGCVELTPE